MALTDILPAVDYSKYACNVVINQQPLPAGFQIISVQVKQAYQYITSAQIVLKLSVGFGNSPITSSISRNLPVAGTAIAIKAKLEFDEVVLFEGNIVRHKFRNTTNGTRLQITAKNKLVNIALSTQTEVFSGQTDKDIIDSIVSRHGGTMTVSNVTTQFLVRHTQLVKNMVNDWDFINVRAEANGCFVYTENDKVIIDKPTPAFDPLKVVAATYGQNIFEVEIEQDERKYQVEEELITFDLSSFENEITTEEIQPSLPPTVKGNHSRINYRTFNDLESTDLINAATQLKALSKKNGLAHIKANLLVKPGFTLEINGFNEMADGKFIITSVMHDYSEGGFSTYIQFGLNHESYSSKFNLQSIVSKPVIVTGLVTQLQNDPDNLNRIQVRIASWQHAQEPVWARLSTQYAGDKYGMVLLPEIGDEVIVAFMGTDFDVPCILGSVFSPKLPPHTAFTDDNYDKVFITKKGMKWAWNDEKNIHEISTPNGNKILISDEEHSITVEDEHSNKMVMNETEINFSCSKDITIKATANIKLEGAVIEIKSSGSLTLKGATVLIN